MTTDVARMTKALAKKLGGYGELGRRLGVSGRAPKHWADGARTPRPAIRAKLEALAATCLDADAPDAPRAAPTIGKAPRATAPAAHGPDGLRARLATRVAASAPTREQMETLVADLDAMWVEALSDPAASYRDRAAVGTAKTAALRTLATMRGEGALTAAQVIRSHPFREAMAVLEGALAPHTEACRAVAVAMEKFTRESA